MTEHRVIVDALNIDYPAARVVNNLSFTLGNERLALVGESGSGKSMSARALMGLVRKPGMVSARQLNVLGNDLLTLNARRWQALRGNGITMVLQDPRYALNPVKSVAAQLDEALTLHQRLPRSERVARIHDIIRAVGLSEHVLQRYPGELSGGMGQRVMIAIALINNPQVLIADEPTSALDARLRNQILELLVQQCEARQMAMLLISHDLPLVAEHCDRVLVMYQGEAVETGSVEQIFHDPQHPYTRALLTAVPRLGAMNGSNLPRRFPLISLKNGGQQEAETEQDTVMPGDPILQVRDLVTRFPLRGGLFNRVKREVHAVENVSFDLWPGETLSLVGESGSGKSTTGRALLRLVEAQEGTITFNGERIDTLEASRLQPLRRDIQYIFQDPYASLDPRQTVGYSIMEPLRVHKMLEGEAAQRRVAWLLERVGLKPEHAWRYPHEFSGGQRQRICIARALALNPKVVIADEAVSALDVSIRAQIINLLLDLQREMGIAFLFISHDMAVVERISHRVAVMYLGQIVEIGPRRAVFENPQHPYTRKLMAAVPVADPAHRRPQRVLLQDELPGNIRKRGEFTERVTLREVSPGHFVALPPQGNAVSRL